MLFRVQVLCLQPASHLVHCQSIDSTSKYFQSSSPVFHLFHYHPRLLPSLTCITTIDLQLVSLFLFLSPPKHYPNPLSRHSDNLKTSFRLYHCLFNNSKMSLEKSPRFLSGCTCLHTSSQSHFPFTHNITMASFSSLNLPS